MGMKDQMSKIKDNWLLLVLLVVVVLAVLLFSGGGSIMNSSYDSFSSKSMGMMESASYRDGGYPSYVVDFAPEVEERKITKTSTMGIETERREYKSTETKLKAIIESSDSYLLNENVNTYGTGKKSYIQGYYQIKVDTEKYSAIVTQLKELGEVTSFNENARDITGSYTNVELELEVEKERLKRYQEMYDDAKEISDKIDLNDRIFNQERTIKYLEDSLKNMDSKVDYSTISVNMQEEQSGYMNVILVKFSTLVKNLVNSINTLLKLLFVLLPWAVIIFIFWFIVKLLRR
ncbi:MAG: DUF4349 domain-containing protein [Nanoarchaeota archaeon]|nr:DUF4349 domain-containing protein [Nanoarchaeota archaeon]MBU1030345.1 DUF4349 domain-containing protein [Nanoarchaeota archaeon]MBU1849805.1 DUF4349 domain-containing protein [Nanoarchaeota archaeon]